MNDKAEAQHKKLDIIIPVLNEEKILRRRSDYFSALKQKANIIFVDGSSCDRTVDVGKQYGKVVCSRPGRSIQKNIGTQNSRSENLLFLHVDTRIDPEQIGVILQSLEENTVGCLTMKIDDSGWIFRLYEKIVNFRAKHFGILDGDLGLFVRRKTFHDLGMFDRIPVMEDIVFGRKIRKIAKPAVLPIPIVVSGRKWRERGFLYTFCLYTLAYIQLWTKIPFFRFKNISMDSKERNQNVKI